MIGTCKACGYEGDSHAMFDHFKTSKGRPGHGYSYAGAFAQAAGVDRRSKAAGISMRGAWLSK